MINMKSLKIFLAIVMLQISVQAHSDDALADLVKVILGAKLIEGIAQEFSGENTNQQNYSSDNRVNTSSGNEGSLGYQYYVLGQKSCKSGDHQRALKWFRESKQQGYVRSVENVYKACSGKSVQYSQSEVESNKGSLGYQLYRIGKKHCKKGETQQAIKWFKESKQQGYKWADRAIDNVYLECRGNTAYTSNQVEVCSNGVSATAYVDNECPSNNRWSNNNAEISSSEKDLNKLKIDYINKIASKVKNQWRYYGAQDEWGCDVYILQDENGNVKGHNLKSCYIGDINKEGSFKNAVKRAIFKSSPLPLAPDGVAFDKHIVFRFKVDNAKDNYQVSNLNKVINQKNETISYKKFCKKLGKAYRNKHFGLAKSLANDGINQNNACAQYYFGLMHHKGDGVNLNYSKAIKWYEKSYKQGFSRAGHALSDMYGNGEYVTYDYRKSLDYAISASNGNNPPNTLVKVTEFISNEKTDVNISDTYVSDKTNSNNFSDLWSQYGGSILDSNTNSSSNKGNSYSVSETDTQPPVIRFNHSDSLSVNDKQATISGVIKDSSKITELLIKGKEVAIDENGNFSISRYIRLGRNTFDVVALDAFGNKVTKVITITRQKNVAKNLDKPLDFPSFKGRRDENAVALIIGLDKYETITNAPWAESDAFVFYDYAQQSLGISADRISLITGNQSDRSGIWKSLDRWLPTMVEKNDSNVYVYFAGHGLASADGKKAYLLPYDGDPDMLDRTAIPRQEVIDGLKDLKARSVTLFMDTCYSGTPKGGNGTLVADSRGLRIIKKNNFSALPKNFTIFSAASNDETASSHPTLDNGLFSYWMMRGLGGEADNNNDRKITNGELHKFINKNVKKAAVLMGRKQNSQLVGDVNKVIASW